MNRKITLFLFFSALMLLCQSLCLFGDDGCLMGRVAIEYSANGRIVQTPLRGIEVNLTSRGIAGVRKTATNRNGWFYFYDLRPTAGYEISFTFGDERLVIYERRLGAASEEVDSEAFKFIYTDGDGNIGIFIVEKGTIRSMQL